MFDPRNTQTKHKPYTLYESKVTGMVNVCWKTNRQTRNWQTLNNKSFIIISGTHKRQWQRWIHCKLHCQWAQQVCQSFCHWDLEWLATANHFCMNDNRITTNSQQNWIELCHLKILYVIFTSCSILKLQSLIKIVVLSEKYYRTKWKFLSTRKLCQIYGRNKWCCVGHHCISCLNLCYYYLSQN